MRIGIPGGLLFYEYNSLIVDFFSRLGVDTLYSVDTNQEILDLGISHCVDEACLPIKIFCGHAAKLLDQCDFIVVPRVKICPGGESICPKFEGLPELVRTGLKTDKCAFTEPLYLNDVRKVFKSLAVGGRKIGLEGKAVKKALLQSYANHIQKEAWGGDHYYTKAGTALYTIGRVPEAINDQGYERKILLLGHTYNVYDGFANRNTVKKLRELGVGVVTGNTLNPERAQTWDDLMKQPYWQFFIDAYGSALEAVNSKLVDGIVYLSSFNCGTDSIAIDMLRRKIGEMPMLVLKLDEQTGEAGMQTRIEAFAELLERRDGVENYLSPFGGRPHHGQAVFQ